MRQLPEILKELEAQGLKRVSLRIRGRKYIYTDGALRRKSPVKEHALRVSPFAVIIFALVLISFGNFIASPSFLFRAVNSGNFFFTKLSLFFGANVNAKNKFGLTPLHKAALKGWYNIANLLISHGALVNVRNNYGYSPLYLAAKSEHNDIVRLLISHGASPNEIFPDGNTLLHWAVKRGDESFVEELLFWDVNVNFKNNNGWTPLHLAVIENESRIVKALIVHGADVNVKDRDGLTPLHWAVRKGYIKMVKVLIKNGANVNAKDGNGATPLMWACYKADLEMVKYLYSKGADPKIKGIIWIGQNSYYGSAIAAAAGEGKVNIVKFLIEKAGVNVDDRELRMERKGGGWTALHWAAARGHISVAKVLITHWADINIKDYERNTPLDLAIIFRNREVADLLRHYGGKCNKRCR